jgi:hypothetical protein
MTFLTASLITACGQTKKQSLIEKKSIDIERVDRIEISKRAIPPDTTKYALKVLSDEQAKLFIDKWNHTDNPELRKYLPSYNLTIYLKSGALRHFRIGGKFIKENNDYCLDFGDEKFFADFFSNSSDLTNRQDSVLRTGWYYISDNETNYKRQLDKTSEFYFIDPNVIVPVQQFDKIELTESKYDNEKYPMIIIRFDFKGTDNWSIATEKSIGGKLALILNDKLVIAPKVNAQITAGVSAINRSDYSQQDIDEIFKTIETELNEK